MDDEIKKAAGEVADDGKWTLFHQCSKRSGNEHCKLAENLTTNNVCILYNCIQVYKNSR